VGDGFCYSIGIAWSENCNQVWLGIHSGDHHIYPDCRLEFFQAMRQAMLLASDNRIELAAPFLMSDKVGILKTGL